MKTQLKRRSSGIFLKKLVLLFAIYGVMLLGPVIFASVYYIQAARFQEKALREIEMNERHQIKTPNLVLGR